MYVYRVKNTWKRRYYICENEFLSLRATESSDWVEFFIND